MKLYEYNIYSKIDVFNRLTKVKNTFKTYSIMKKTLFTIAILGAILVLTSCDYDDSNDLDVLTPNTEDNSTAESTD